MAPVPIEIELVSYNPLDTIRLGLTSLPNAAADAAGGLPISDAGGLDLDAFVAAAPTVGQIADAVWDEVASGHTTAGTYGNYFYRMMSGVGTRIKMFLAQLNIEATGNDDALYAKGSGTGAGQNNIGGATGIGMLNYGNTVGQTNWGSQKGMQNVSTAGAGQSNEGVTYGTRNTANNGNGASNEGGGASGIGMINTGAGTGKDLSSPDNDLSTGSGLSAQEVRDAMLLAPGDAADSGSIDDQLASIFSDTQNISTNTSNDLPSIIGDLQNTADAIETKVDTIDGIVDTILIDTADMQPRVTAIEVDTGTTIPSQISGLNNISLAGVNAEVDTALSDINLDHLLKEQAETTDVAASSVIARLASANADFAAFDYTTDSLEAIRDRGDVAWLTGAGGSAPTVEQIRTEMDTNSTKLTVIDGNINDIETLLGVVDVKVDIIDTNVDTIVSKLPSGSISEFSFSSVTDGMTFGYISQLIAAMVNGRYVINPVSGDMTIYQRDNATVLTVVKTTTDNRTRVS